MILDFGLVLFALIVCGLIVCFDCADKLVVLFCVV